MIYLKEANENDIEKEWLFVRDIPEDENGFTNSLHGISREKFAEWAVPKMIAYSKGIDVPEGFVPETFYFLWDDDEIVGQFRLRHYLCDSLRTGAGHIGYFIGKQYRGRGYGKEGLKLLLEKAKDIVPEDEYYLRLDRENTPSLRVMLANGGRIVGEDEQKLYVRIKK